MAQSDFSSMSDAELLNAINKPEQKVNAPVSDTSSMTDADLLNIANKNVQPETTWGSRISAIGAGLRHGAEGVAGALGDTEKYVPQIAGWASEKLGASPETRKSVEEAVKTYTPYPWKYSPLALGAKAFGYNGETSLPTSEEIGKYTTSKIGKEYEPKTPEEKILYTGASFVPGAVAGPGSVVRNVAAGAGAGLGSEALGQYAEYRNWQDYAPWARLAGSLAGGLAGSAGVSAGEKMISPYGGAFPSRLDQAAVLEKHGVKTTAGQKVGSPTLVQAEANTKKGQSFAGDTPESDQAAMFTQAALRTIGSNAKFATPNEMAAQGTRLGEAFDKVFRNVSISPSQNFVKAARDASDYYVQNAPTNTAIPLFRNITNRIESYHQNGQQIPGDVLKNWRTNLGKHSVSPNPAEREAAHQLIDAIDNDIENTFTSLGYDKRMKFWKDTREQYRNYLVLLDALKSGDEAALGVITPRRLLSSVNNQGKAASRAAVTGRRGDIGELARAGVAVLQPLPRPSMSGKIVDWGSILGGAGGLASSAYTYPAVSQFAGPGLGALTAFGLPAVSGAYGIGRKLIHSMAMNPLMQKYYANQLVQPSKSQVLAPLMRGYETSGQGVEGQASGGRIGRQTGGRVGNPGADADRLIMAAEKSKKQHSKRTSPLLNVPDEAISKALSVANENI